MQSKDDIGSKLVVTVTQETEAGGLQKGVPGLQSLHYVQVGGADWTT